MEETLVKLPDKTKRLQGCNKIEVMGTDFHPIENSSDTAAICVPILIDLYKPKSVLDLGCNTGWWLHWFMKHGVNDVMGIDGDNMLTDLKIPIDKFKSRDLTKAIDLHRRFDLVLCLEVAEHLGSDYADVIVDTAARHADIVFWSAADIGQGGYHHVNEQPTGYWKEKFEERGYAGRALNTLLPTMPHDYYRKNAMEFINGVIE